jgi:phosphoglycolate phosphatase-like HAD superfamily hydrolase
MRLPGLQFGDHTQDVGEQVSQNGDPGHLERHVARMAHDLRADLDQLLLQARQRPVPYRLGRRQRAQEIAEVVGERTQLKTNRVGGEESARQPRPADRARALLDPLLASSALVVEGDDVLRPARHIDDFRYCPLHPDGSVEAYRRLDEWRKPEPGMLRSLAEHWPIDMSRSVMMGNKDIDAEAAHAAGIEGVEIGPKAILPEIRILIERMRPGCAAMRPAVQREIKVE